MSLCSHVCTARVNHRNLRYRVHPNHRVDTHQVVCTFHYNSHTRTHTHTL